MGTRRIKKLRKKQSRKKVHGGTQKHIKRRPPDGVPNWPDAKGCLTLDVKSVPLGIGTLLDRFGGTKGFFVAVLERDLITERAKPASYSSRSLRALGETAFPFTVNNKTIDLRRELYEMIYTHSNDTNNELYYILRVAKPIDAIHPCKAAPAFGYKGGALQVELQKSIQDYLDDGTLEKLSSAETLSLIHRYFPPYEDPNDGNDAAFTPFNKSLYSLRDRYYSTAKMREEFLAKHHIAPTPGGVSPAPLVPMTTAKVPSSIDHPSLFTPLATGYTPNAEEESPPPPSSMAGISRALFLSPAKKVQAPSVVVARPPWKR